MKSLFSFAMLLASSFAFMESDRADAEQPAPERERPRNVGAKAQKPAVDEPVLGKPATEKQVGGKPAGPKNTGAKSTGEKKTVENKPGEMKAAQKNADAKPVEPRVPAEPRGKAVPPLNLDAIVQPLRALFGGVPVAAPPAAGPAENAAGVEAQLNALNEQYLQQLMPIRSAELSFVRLLCSDLTPDQRRKIKIHADAGLKNAARRMADQNQQPGNGGRRNANSEPEKLIREAIASALKETLTEEQWARFTVEADARAAIRKRIAIECVVSRMDEQLFLTPEQREKVTESISSKWQPQWEKWISFSQTHGDRYFPVVPDQHITPHLTGEQKSVWQGIQKVDVGWWMNQTQENLEDDWWNVPSDKADDQPGNLRFQPTEIFK